MPCGTTGESATLDHEEHEQVIGAVVRTADGRIPVLAGTGSNSTAEAVRLTRFAEKVGADGALLITPYYNKPTQRGLKEHFEAVAKETDLPLVLYNVPSRTGVNMLPSTVAALAALPNVLGIKEASGSIDQAVEILRDADIELLSGDDSLTLALMSVGAQGPIGGAPAVNALGFRRGLMAFRITQILHDPDGPGSVLNFIRIEICAQSAIPVQPGPGATNTAVLVQ